LIKRNKRIKSVFTEREKIDVKLVVEDLFVNMEKTNTHVKSVEERHIAVTVR